MKRERVTDINRARAKRLFQSGNTLLDDKGNIWNVLEVDSSIKNKHCWYQLMQLRDSHGYRKYDRLIQGNPGQTLRSAQKKIIKRCYNDNYKNVKYNAITNKVEKVIE